jgi:hypothetical protein
VAEEERSEWSGPWLELAKFLNMIVPHALGVVALAGIGRVASVGISIISPTVISWQIKNVVVTLDDLIHYFDLAIVILFFIKASWNLLMWAFRK